MAVTVFKGQISQQTQYCEPSFTHKKTEASQGSGTLRAEIISQRPGRVKSEKVVSGGEDVGKRLEQCTFGAVSKVSGRGKEEDFEHC